MLPDSWHPTDIRREAAAGRWLDGAPSGDGIGEGRIEARALREVLENPGGLRAVRLRNWQIDGALELAGVSFAGELALESCELHGDLDLTRSDMGAVWIVKSAINGSIRADSVSISSSLVLDGSMVLGTVFAPNASVAGRVSCDGVKVAGASVEGYRFSSLVFEGATIKGRFSARRLEAGREVTFNRARISGELDLRDAKLRGSPVALRVENVRVADIAFINSSEAYGAFRADGKVLVAGSEFGRGLNCTGIGIGDPAHEDDATDRVFDARNVKVGGEFFLNHGTIIGGVALTGAKIEGQLNLSGLKLRGVPDVAIDAQGMRVETDLWLDDCFEAASAVILDRVTVGGSLNAVAGRFAAGRRPGTPHHGIALSLASASIGGNLVLADESWTVRHRGPDGISGFFASGTVVLTDTHVARRLEASGGVFDGCGGDALRAHGVRVGTDMRLAGSVGADGELRFEAYGPVRMSRGAIEGSVDLTGSRLTLRPRLGEQTALPEDDCVLDASLLRVGDRLVLREMQDLCGRVSLVGAQVGTLSDDSSYWREVPTVLELDDFSYRLLDRDELDWREGRDWLKRLHHYRAQPFLELARIERELGRTRDARRLNIERHEARLAGQALPPGSGRVMRAANRLARGGDHAVGLLVGWGYARWRLAPMWAALLTAATIMFSWAGHHGLLRPSHPPITRSAKAPTSSRCVSSYPCFEAFTYSLDVILPVVDLNQRNNWYADSRSARGREVAITSLILTLFGWGFASLLAASFTNVLKRE